MAYLVRLTILLLVFLLSGSGVATANTDLQGKRAREIQAAFLLQFCRYVKWPPTAFSSAKAPIVVGILGRDPFGSILDDIARPIRVSGRNIEVHRYNELSRLKGTHILFISPSEVGRMPQIVKYIENEPVLLVSNKEGFLENDGIINFVMVKKKIRFNIHRKNSKRRDVKISSKLFKVANKIY